MNNRAEEMKSPYENGCMMHYAFEEANNIECADYLKGIYSATVKELLPLVEDLCDKMEVDGSTMYDEYPDKVRLNTFVKHLYDSYKGEKNECLYDIIQVLLVQEILLRRCRRQEWKKRLQEE